MRRFISASAIIATVLLVSLVGAKPIYAESLQDADALSGREALFRNHISRSCN